MKSVIHEKCNTWKVRYMKNEIFAFCIIYVFINHVNYMNIWIYNLHVVSITWIYGISEYMNIWIIWIYVLYEYINMWISKSCVIHELYDYIIYWLYWVYIIYSIEWFMDMCDLWICVIYSLYIIHELWNI